MPITYKRVRVKCPICGVIACYNPITSRHKWLLYSCVRCGLEWRMEKGWRTRIMQAIHKKQAKS
jgi:hypothetical protein